MNRVCAFAVVVLLFAQVPAGAGDEPPSLDQVWLTRPGKENYGSAGFAAGRIWVAHRPGEVYGLAPKTGEVERSAKLEGNIYGGLTAAPSGIYVLAATARGHVALLDEASGEVRWIRDLVT